MSLANPIGAIFAMQTIVSQYDILRQVNAGLLALKLDFGFLSY